MSSVTPPNSHIDDESLDPLIVQKLREHGESLSPDGLSRDRIWQRIQSGLSSSAQPGFIDRLRRLMNSPQRWKPVWALLLVVGAGVPFLLLQSPSPDWNGTVTKGISTVHLTAGQRTAFIADLKQAGIRFDDAPQAGPTAIRIQPADMDRLDARFREKWAIPPGPIPFVLVFE